MDPPPLTETDFDLDGQRVKNNYGLLSLQVSVLLAACRRTEKARGDSSAGGLFTRALLKKLRDPGASARTYSELFYKFEINHE